MRTRLPDFSAVAWVGFALAACWLAFTLTGCAGQTYPHAPLFKQIVRMRPGHSGLTHQVCAERDWLGKCKKFDLLEYDLQNAEVRAQLSELEFICKVAGSRYKIDKDQPRLIRIKYERKCWLCKKEPVVEKAIMWNATNILLDSGTFCYSEKAYPDGLQP